MKKVLSKIMACAVMVSLLGGCSSSKPGAQTPTEAVTAVETTTAETAVQTTQAQTTQAETKEAETTVQETKAEGTGESVTLRVGSLKGPTTMGLVSLMDKASKGEAKGSYEFTMVTAADELVGQIVSGNLDIALIPANLASILYKKNP